MFYTVYRIKNLCNGRIYIGAHRTENLDDGYLGSGMIIRQAVKLYGREAFHKDILFLFTSEEEMLSKEAELVNREFCDREDTYNLKEGGHYGKHSEASRKKISDSGKIAQNLPEVRARNSSSSKKRMSDPANLEKLHRASKEYWTPEKLEEHSLRMREIHSLPDQKEKRSLAIKNSWSSLSPVEREQRISRAREACTTSEYRDRMSDIAKKVQSSPEVKQRQREGVKKSCTPERRAEMSSLMRDVHSRSDGSRGAAISAAHGTPEGKAKLALRRRKGETLQKWEERISGEVRESS